MACLGRGGGGSPHLFPSQSIMGPFSHWAIPSHVTLLFLYKKPPSPFYFSLPSQQAVKQANGIVVSHFLFLISFQSKSLSLTFSGELKGEDGSPLFKRSRLSIGCLNVYLNAVKDGLAKRKIHPLRRIKLMLGIARIQGT